MKRNVGIAGGVVASNVNMRKVRRTWDGPMAHWKQRCAAIVSSESRMGWRE